jgi:FAD/FMN-containing dehydrogenase
MIDLSSMCAVRVDPNARRAQVQGGATWGDVDRETQAFGLAVSGGVVSSTGVAGLTLAGGYGWLRSKYGLTCDMLRSVDVVTAAGELLTANAQQNADLYWAVRGGGGNFGIVTNFEFDLADIGTEVAFCAVMYPVEHAREIMQAWRQCVATAPDEFTTDCHLWAVPALEGFPPELWGRSVTIVAGVYCGDLDEGERFIAPLRRLADPLLDLSGRWPFLHVQQAFDPVFPHNEHLHYWKSLYLNRFDAKVWDVVLEHFARKPSPRTLVATRALNGAVRRVAADATAFGDRSAPFLISIDSTWEDAEATEANISWTRGLWSALQPYSGGRTYFSFAGMMEEGDALVRRTFGTNYARLAEIKRKYDPDNFFRLNQNIKPAGE